MKSTEPQHGISYYRRLALRKIRERFPEADSTCFSSRYDIGESRGQNVFVDNEAEWAYPGSWYPHDLNILETEFINRLAEDGLKNLADRGRESGMQRIVSESRLHAGRWMFSAPVTAPDERGFLVASRMSYDASCEYFEWGISDRGTPYEEHLEDGHQEGSGQASEPELSSLSLEEFGERLTYLRSAVRGTEVEAPWCAAYEELERLAAQNHARMMEAVSDSNPVVGRFVVYDLFSEGTPARTIVSSGGHESRLEKYRFDRRKDGTVELFVQEGWFAGSHWDGGGGFNEIPREWFGLPWSGFLDLFSKRFPKKDFSFGRYELEAVRGLKEFLGFGVKPATASGGRHAGQSVMGGNSGSAEGDAVEVVDPAGQAPLAGRECPSDSSSCAGGVSDCMDFGEKAVQPGRAWGAGIKKAIGNELHVGRWIYSAPSLNPNASGCLVATQKTSDSPCEYFEWGIDGDGFPYEAYEYFGDERVARKNYRKRLPPEQFVQQIRMLHVLVRGSELETAWGGAYREFARIASDRLKTSGAAPVPKIWYCTECGTKHEGGRFCMNCGAMRYDLREAGQEKMYRQSSSKRMGSIALERDSVSMGDDCHAPHRMEVRYEEDCLISTFMREVAAYLPPMRYKGWLVCCGAERLAMMYSGSDAAYAWELLVPDQRLASLPEQELFCIAAAELYFADGEERPCEAECIRLLAAKIRNSEFF